MASYDLHGSLTFVAKWEGGFVDDPDDAGGRTNFGVTQATYDAWRAARGQAKADVLHITQDEVHAIYEANYWRAASCHELAAPLGTVVFDFAVNSGVKRAVQYLQRAAGVSADGKFGPGTRAAVAARDPVALARAVCDAREGFYHAIVAARPANQKFLKGWLRRLNDLRKYTLLTPAGFAPVEWDPAAGALPTPRLPDLGDDPDLDAALLAAPDTA